jgi:Transposase zinc-binding domain
VIELADVFRRFADGYLSAHGAAMPASHRRAIADIPACRTEALGGRLWRSDQCSHEVFSYDSCKKPLLSQMPHQADQGLARCP